MLVALVAAGLNTIIGIIVLKFFIAVIKSVFNTIAVPLVKSLLSLIWVVLKVFAGFAVGIAVMVILL